jgi:spermidine/putrescine transport system substrate-binding protein
MRRNPAQQVSLGMAVLCWLLAGCSGPGPEPTAVSKAVTSVPSDKITTTGFNCPEPNPRVEFSSAELNLYVWSEYTPPDFVECFQLLYGVKVNLTEYNSDEEMYAGATDAAAVYDLIQPTDFAVARMIREGLLLPLDHARLPALPNFNSHYMNLSFDPENRYTIPYEAGIDAIVVNTATVKSPPRSWADLWDPAFQGRLVVADDERAIIGITLLTLGYDVNATAQPQLDQARRALQVLAPGIKAYDSDSPHKRLISGEVDVGETWNGEAFLANEAVPSIQFVYPTEGSILWQDNWAILKSAPHADAAYAWLNYTAQGDVFWMMLTNFPYTNPNQAALDYARDNPMVVTDVSGKSTTLAKVYETFVNSPITNPPAAVIQAGHRIADVGDSTALYDAIWKEVRGTP